MAHRKNRNAFSGNISSTDIHLIRVFVKVIECGGLSVAQSELGVSRSTISRQISDLENRLGLRLCHRGRQGVQLTQHGEKAIEYMRQLLVATSEFSANIASIDEDFVGQLNIGMIDQVFSDPSNPLSEALQQFHEIAPNVTINLSVGSPSEIERNVIDSQIHLGVLLEYREIPELDYTTLYQEECGLMAGGNHPIAKAIRNDEYIAEEDVCKHTLVNRGYYESTIQHNLKQRFPRGPVIVGSEAVNSLIQSGIYLGFGPLHDTLKLNHNVVEVLPQVFRYKSKICCAVRRNRRQSIILNEFYKTLNSVKAD